MTGRKLQPDEKQIWGKVAKTVSPRRAFKGPKSAKPLPPKGPTTQDFANMLRLPPLERPSQGGLPQSLDVNQDKKVRRGRVVIDAKIDLHDMTQNMARPALHRAIMRASNRGHKCCLLYTSPSPRDQRGTRMPSSA